MIDEKLTRNQEWHYISYICDRIRDRTVTEAEMKYLHEHAHPTLVQSMIQYICLRHAGAKYPAGIDY